MPRRSRTSVKLLVSRSHSANANIPIARSTAASTPHKAHASSSTSVSESPRILRPAAASSRRMSRQPARRSARCHLRSPDNARLLTGMRVLLFVRDLAIGGSQRQLATLAAGLARRGHEVAVATLYAGGELESPVRDSGARIL